MGCVVVWVSLAACLAATNELVEHNCVIRPIANQARLAQMCVFRHAGHQPDARIRRLGNLVILPGAK